MRQGCLTAGKLAQPLCPRIADLKHRPHDAAQGREYPLVRPSLWMTHPLWATMRGNEPSADREVAGLEIGYPNERYLGTAIDHDRRVAA